MNTELFLAFVAATVVICIVPGPNITLIITTATMSGVRAGLMTVLGTTAAQVIQIATVVTGLAWLLSAYSYIFDTFRILGAIYLIYLGVRAWRSANSKAAVEEVETKSLKHGFLVGLANPKSLAFLAVFIPQFVDSSLPVNPQFITLAFTYLSVAVLFDAAYAIAAGYGGKKFCTGRSRVFTKRLSGVVLAGGGLWLATLRKS
ncbi:putative threonine efflux protein [Thioflavicoccus mobilis 8321]|uniref:Putative threonine efflux protein n=1 Tax=Thioflavicoccus mobilis 8321 TaxID=765912 RepID=L0GR55_9GAMM|nr:LysE family translocator [Thioflavicoccus mobilis]AGA89233.1 putative threonine efflux protein [Thioflavicoccus mobilis 8321]